MKRTLLVVFLSILASSLMAHTEPIKNLLERIDKGASKKFKTEIVKAADGIDFFELDQEEDKVVIRGNSHVSIATGINWYLKYYANVHLSWNGMSAELPSKLPIVSQKERRETSYLQRYYLNYCTFSYSMAFWDWERWEKEIDWMALHGVNMPLSITGTEVVWYNVLDKLGYSKDEINDFISGSGFMAWWLMNNIEGWGGPNSDRWYKQQVDLQKKILKRLGEYGIDPVFPGYAGMVPSNAKEKLGLDVSDPGRWGGFKRPAFLQPSDSKFDEVADLYYTELENLFGKAKYYSIDPFHEGGSVEGVDLDFAGKAIMSAMKKANKDAVWVAQAWQANPRPEMIDNMEKGDLLVLDLWSEARPMWGPDWSIWYREQGYGKHEWVYCMLLNFGGRTGLHGKMDYVINGFYDAHKHKSGNTLKGVGATMEAIENNATMYELIYELPWRNERFTKESWLDNYTKARYGKSNTSINKAWEILSKTAYAYPKDNVQEGTTETVFAANPQLDINKVSCCSSTHPFYNTDSVRMAAEKMIEIADQFKGNNNFEHDLVDIVRQTIANKAYYQQINITKAFKAGDKDEFNKLKTEFLEMLLAQDYLLETRPEFKVGTWINQARSIGKTKVEKDLYEFNARVQITLWGTQESAENGLNDYAYKEWSGILRDYYYKRWDTFFNHLNDKLDGKDVAEYNSYPISHEWSKATNSYSSKAEGNAIDRAKEVFFKYISNK